MAIIKKNELKNLKEEQIEKKLLDLKDELLKIKAQQAMGGKLDNPGRIKEIKRSIAKLLTKKNQRKVEQIDE